MKTEDFPYMRTRPPRQESWIIFKRLSIKLTARIMEPGSCDTKPIKNHRGPSTLLKEKPVELPRPLILPVIRRLSSCLIIV